MSVTAHVLQALSLFCALDALFVLGLAASPRADQARVEVVLQSFGGALLLLAIACAAAGGLV